MSVVCNGCTACCESETVALDPDRDDASQYLTEIGIHPGHGGLAQVLQRKPNGHCIYLEQGVGCTIHDRRPSLCRDFDCVRVYKFLGVEKAEQLANISPAHAKITKAARDRLT